MGNAPAMLESAATAAWTLAATPGADDVLTWVASLITGGGLVQAYRWWRRIATRTGRATTDREDAVAVVAPTAEMLQFWRSELKATQALAADQRAEIDRLRAENEELRRGPVGCPIRHDCDGHH